MRGHMHERAKGVWSVVIDVGTGPDGKRKQKWVTVHGTKRDAQKELTRLLRERDTGKLQQPGKATVDEYLQRWLSNWAKVNTAPQTFKRYEDAVQMASPTIGAHRLDKLTPLHLQEWCRRQLETGTKASTLRVALSILHKALSQAVRWNLLIANPADAVDLPREEPREMQALTKQQALALLKVAHEDTHGLAVVLALGLGLRAGEVLGLQWGDIDTASRTVSVRRSLEQLTRTFKEPKSGKGREVKLPAFVATALAVELQAQAAMRQSVGPQWNPHNLVVCTHHGLPVYNQFSRHMARMCKAASIPRVRFHDLRHTHATLLLADGENPKVVAERLGHSKVTITLNVYAHVLPGMQDAAAARIDGMLGGA